MHEERNEIHDEQSGTSRSLGLLGLIPECTWGESYGKEDSVFFSTTARVDGQQLTARAKGSFSGKQKKEKTPFWGLSGEAQCECVFMWENINELLPTGRGAVPIISSWENIRRKIERQKKKGGEMKEDQILPFCFH